MISLSSKAKNPKLNYSFSLHSLCDILQKTYYYNTTLYCTIQNVVCYYSFAKDTAVVTTLVRVLSLLSMSI